MPHRFWLSLVLVTAGCVPEPAPDSVAPGPQADPGQAAAFSDLPGWTSGDQSGALPALDRSCERIANYAPDHELGGALAGPASDLQEICAALAATPVPDSAAVRAFLEQWFVPVFQSPGSDEAGLFTGYLELEVAGQRTAAPGAEPLYRPPPDLVEVDLGRFRPELAGHRVAGRVVGGQLVPMPDRAAIQNGALADQGLELVWILDPVDAFFLHIQGSGRVRFADGTLMRVGYAAANGHPYYAIGRTLLRRGEIAKDAISLQSIAAWLRAHPEQMRALMAENRAYVFFAERTGPGPLGAAGVALTPMRSAAVDPRYIPLHFPVWAATRVPAPGGGEETFERLLLAQDTGSAIRGPGRIDVFFGHGPEARERAGRMQSPGQVWVLVPRRSLAGQ